MMMLEKTQRSAVYDIARHLPICFGFCHSLCSAANCRPSAKQRSRAATEVVKCILQQEWQKSIDRPIHEVSTLFSQLRTAHWNAVVHPCVPAGDVNKLHAQLVKIDYNYSKAIMTKENLSKVSLIPE
eukprot:1188387-Ditylum_brightwellii.AAC.1